MHLAIGSLVLVLNPHLFLLDQFKCLSVDTCLNILQLCLLSVQLRQEMALQAFRLCVDILLKVSHQLLSDGLHINLLLLGLFTHLTTEKGNLDINVFEPSLEVC